MGNTNCNCLRKPANVDKNEEKVGEPLNVKELDDNKII